MQIKRELTDNIFLFVCMKMLEIPVGTMENTGASQNMGGVGHPLVHCHAWRGSWLAQVVCLAIKHFPMEYSENGIIES